MALFCPRCHRGYVESTHRHCPDDGALLVDTPRMQQIRVRATKELGAVLDGRYVVRGLIGSGAMASVYVAEDTTTKEPVAVKILRTEFTRNRIARARFLREVEVAASIGHPNVVKVLDAGQRPDGSPFIVLEYLFGESLGDLLRRDDVVDEAFALQFVHAAALGLAAAHKSGIIHRDVKPDNLFLVGERGAPYSLKVVDFGMAKLQEASRISATGTSLGTLAYIAPEQALADPVDARADVYGLGTVMYRMLAGRLPFEMQRDVMLVAHQVLAPPPPPATLRPGLDPRLESVILTALRKHPDNRYPSMEVMAEDLERLLGTRAGTLRAAATRGVRDEYVPVSEMAKHATQMFRKMLENGAV